MAKSDNLRKAKEAKNDEFYTSIETVNDELYFYTTDREDLGLVNQFRDKVVFCNCDDPEWSAFWKYFILNFHAIGLKKLISTHYEPDGSASYKLEWSGETLNNDMVNLIKTPLAGNGDFRSQECIEILKEADIVVTNPPFSLFREYVAQLLEYNKKFVIIGNMNCITYKEIFPLLKDNKMWAGYGFNKIVEFIMPDDYELIGKAFIDENGKKHGFVPAICWFTNMVTKPRSEFLPVYDYYYGNEHKYPRYFNYDGIDVKALDDIPCDYDGIMGVPITIFQYYNPEQFEIIGIGSHVEKTMSHTVVDTPEGKTIAYIKDGKTVWSTPYSVTERKIGNSLRIEENGVPRKSPPYGRILIRNKHPKPRKGGAA